MSHVDDGVLHAYLDGALGALGDAGELPDGVSAAEVVAHLSTCADCRSRLEAERTIREGAGLVMSDLPRPSDAVPARTEGSFSTGRALAGSQSGRRSSWLRLSWAASVVLAIGAGWWGSETWRMDRDGIALEQSAPASRAPSGVAGDPTSGGVDDVFDAPPGPSSDAVDASVADDARLGVDASRSALPETRAPVRADDVPVVASPTRSEAAPLGVVIASGSAPFAVDSVARLAAPQFARTQNAPAARSLLPASSEGAPSVAMDLAEGRQVLLARMVSSAAFDTVIARETAGELTFVDGPPVTPQGASEPVFIIADASEPAIATALDGTRTIVRVRQWLTSGEPIEILYWQPDSVAQLVPMAGGYVAAAKADAKEQATVRVIQGAARERPDGRNEVIVHAFDVPAWIAIRAHLRNDEVRALAGRLTTH